MLLTYYAIYLVFLSLFNFWRCLLLALIIMLILAFIFFQHLLQLFRAFDHISDGKGAL